MVDVERLPYPNLSGIPSDYVAVVPSDAADNTGESCIGLYVTVAGNVRAVLKGGVVRDLPVPAQTPLPGLFERVHSTGTTATGIFAIIG